MFLRMLNQIREGDRVVVWKLARSTRDLGETMGPSDRWVLGSPLSQVWEDSTTHVGKMMMTLKSTLPHLP